tara:strand:- start:1800 stop:2336 length:537 start_codon:yes stop_codon:yes gene_type:complete
MAKISNTTVYPNIVPAAGDYLILTDVNDSDRTKTAMVSDFQNFFGTTSIETTLTSAQILSSFTTPAILIPGVTGYHIQPISILVKSTFVTTAYVFAGDVAITLGSYSPVNTTVYTVNEATLEQASSKTSIPIPATSSSVSEYTNHLGGDNLLAVALVGAPTLGDGTITFDIMYRLVKA